jgi:hypothetical protein
MMRPFFTRLVQILFQFFHRQKAWGLYAVTKNQIRRAGDVDFLTQSHDFSVWVSQIAFASAISLNIQSSHQLMPFLMQIGISQ